MTTRDDRTAETLAQVDEILEQMQRVIDRGKAMLATSRALQARIALQTRRLATPTLPERAATPA